MRPNKRVNINTKGIKNFLVCLLKIKINTTAKINNSMGILLPESIIATKNMINKIGIKNLEYLDIFWKYRGKIKNEKIQNLCIKKGLRSIICFSTKYLNMKYKNKYLKKKIDFITVEKYPFQAFSSK